MAIFNLKYKYFSYLKFITLNICKRDDFQKTLELVDTLFQNNESVEEEIKDTPKEKKEKLLINSARNCSIFGLILIPVILNMLSVWYLIRFFKEQKEFVE